MDRNKKKKLILCGASCNCGFDEEYTKHDFYDGLSQEYCPICECTSVTSIGNEAEHPNVFIKWNCACCNLQVAVADNGSMEFVWNDQEFWNDISKS